MSLFSRSTPGASWLSGNPPFFGLLHPAAGHRQRAGERLDGGLRVGANRGEEPVPLVGREVLPAAVVDQARVDAHLSRPGQDWARTVEA